MKYHRINIHGGPCTGKSVIAARLFADLKIRGYDVELVNEWVKSWAWLSIVPTQYDQIYIFAKQLRKEEIVLRKGGIIVSDSPLWMILAYTYKHCKAHKNYRMYDALSDLSMQFESQYPAINIGLLRTTDYQQNGRYENEEQAKIMDELIAGEVTNHALLNCNFSPQDYSTILDYVTINLEK